MLYTEKKESEAPRTNIRPDKRLPIFVDILKRSLASAPVVSSRSFALSRLREGAATINAFLSLFFGIWLTGIFDGHR